MSKKVDVLILGGGPAGLAVAGGLARQLHTGIVFSSGSFRNGAASHMHNVPGWDHEDPVKFRAKSRADILARYSTIQFRDVGITGVKKLEGGGFEAVDDAGERYEGRKIVLANGIQDIMPQIPGYSELWGKGIFHCLFCHGYEERGSSSAGLIASGLLGNTMFAPSIARMANRLAGAVNVYTDGNEALGAEIRIALKSTKKFHVENRKIKSLAKDHDVQGEAGVLVTLDDGTINKEGFLAHAPEFKLNSSFADELGVDLAPQGHINALPPFFSTNVPGVFAAGDCATLLKSVPTATMMGSFVAAGLAHTLQAEDDVEE
ncbi:putative thioredoxin reductase [Rosellinia necatrix]|uniref:Putative thioredoxin reductase n=1 Tax=Rosellinia necatrix TaxID=77044 RepID=A0A1W2TAX6_ROSNE|nr:putative thioredoxin reductase [Rosellinia necatrix]